MKQVLIIGANSYIARSFVRYIKKKENEICVTTVHATNGEWMKEDLSNYDSVVIVAAIVHQKETVHNKELFFEVNYDLPIQIARKAKDEGVTQVVFFSTMAVYGKKASCITENTKPNPDTLYGKSKLQAECALQKLITKNFIITILRPPMVYGSGCKGNYNRLVKFANIVPIYPRIHNKRSRISIHNLCSYLDEVLQNPTSGIFKPQDEMYADTIEIIKEIRASHNKTTVFIPGFEKGIRYCLKFNSTLRKVFGDYYYQKEKEHGI